MGIVKKAVKKIKLGAVLISFICGATLSFNGVFAGKDSKVLMKNSKVKVNVKNKKNKGSKIKTKKRSASKFTKSKSKKVLVDDPVKKAKSSRAIKEELDLCQKEYEEMGLGEDNEDKPDAVIFFYDVDGDSEEEQGRQFGLLAMSPTYVFEKSKTYKDSNVYENFDGYKFKDGIFFELEDENGTIYRNENKYITPKVYSEGDCVFTQISNFRKDQFEEAGIPGEEGRNDESFSLEDGEIYKIRIYDDKNFDEAVLEGTVKATKSHSFEKKDMVAACDDEIGLSLEKIKEIAPQFRHPEKFNREYYLQSRNQEGLSKIPNSKRVKLSLREESEVAGKEDEISSKNCIPQVQYKLDEDTKLYYSLGLNEFKNENNEDKPDAVIFFNDVDGNSKEEQGRQIGLLAASPSYVYGRSNARYNFKDSIFFELEDKNGAIYRNENKYITPKVYSEGDCVFAQISNFRKIQFEEAGISGEEGRNGESFSLEDGETYKIRIYNDENFDEAVLEGTVKATKSHSLQEKDIVAACDDEVGLSLEKIKEIAPQFQHPGFFCRHYYMVYGKFDFNNEENSKDAETVIKNKIDEDEKFYYSLNLDKSQEKPDAVVFFSKGESADYQHGFLAVSPTYIIENGSSDENLTFENGLIYDIEDENGAIFRTKENFWTSRPYSYGDYMISTIFNDYEDDPNPKGEVRIYSGKDGKCLKFEDNKFFKLKIYDKVGSGKAIFEGRVLAKEISRHERYKYSLGVPCFSEKIAPYVKHPKEFNKEYYINQEKLYFSDLEKKMEARIAENKTSNSNNQLNNYDKKGRSLGSYNKNEGKVAESERSNNQKQLSSYYKKGRSLGSYNKNEGKVAESERSNGNQLNNYNKREIDQYEEKYKKFGLGKNNEDKSDAVLFFLNESSQGEEMQLGFFIMSPTNIIEQSNINKKNAFLGGLFYEIEDENGAIYRSDSLSVPYGNFDYIAGILYNESNDTLSYDKDGVFIKSGENGEFLKFKDQKTYTLRVYDGPGFDNVIFKGEIKARETSNDSLKEYVKEFADNKFLFSEDILEKLAPQIKHPEKFDREYYEINHKAFLYRFSEICEKWVEQSKSKN